jgi:PAS domain S-box-containing protein
MGKKSSLKINNPQSLRALIVDDSENDALLIIRELKKGGYNPSYERVETATTMKKALKANPWDIILCDYKMPKFSAPSAITLLKKTNTDIPLIIVSGSIGEETAVECMRLGAQDYIMKSRLSRLCPAIARELEEVRIRNKQKQAEEELRQSEEKYRTIIENIQEGYFEIDLAGNFIFFNDSTCRCLGYSKKELIGMNYKKYTDKENANKLFKAYNKTYTTGTTSRLLEYEIIKKDGTKRQLEGFVSLQKDSSGNPLAFRGTVRDITERKQAEKTLKDSEERYRALFDRSLDIIYTIDFDGNFIDANPTALKRFGYTKKDLPSINVASLMDKDQLQYALKVIQEIKKYGVQKDLLEIMLRHKGGTPIYIETKGSAVMSGGKAIAIQSIARDITERKAAEQKLLQSEKYFKEITENSSDIIIITDKNGDIKYCSRSMERFSGYTPEELIGKSGFTFIHPDDLERAVSDYSKAISSNDTAIPNGFRMIHKDGTERYLEGLGKNLLDNPDVAGFIMNVHDATESKKAEEKLKESEKKYRIITEKMTDIVWLLDMNLRTIYVTPSIQTVLGFTQEERMSQTIDQQLTPDSLNIALETMAKELALEEQGQQDDQSNVILELEYYHKDGSTRWIETIMSGLRNDQGVLDRIHGVSRDITARRKAEEKLLQTLESLRKAFGVTMQVMVAAIEMRDPYTAGHQVRATDIARAIATEMGLSPEKIDGIRMAGAIHDIGKLSIPAEILSKPTKLTDIEFSLIKEHSHSGYEMLKNVESPWPLAEIIYQHHERINGTGYPRNLKGEEILIEARILAVADVAEAMASHRPYRASLGIDAALEEIEKNKGTLYDIVVVDAFLKLFREKKFQLL